MSPDPEQLLRFFTNYGFQSNSNHNLSAKDITGLCPFCEHPKRKFSLNLTSSKWRCFHCSRTGNWSSYLHQIYDDCPPLTDTLTKQICDRRGFLYPTTLVQLDARTDWRSPEDSFFLPLWSPADNNRFISNLKSFSLRTGTWYNAPKPAPTTLACLYRPPPGIPCEEVWICEGEWDGMALLTARNLCDAPITILATPGAGTFLSDWVNYPVFQKKRVVICYDNDTPGREGAEKVERLITSHASSILTLQWPKNTKTGFDLDDWFRRLRRGRTGKAAAMNCLDNLRNHCQNGSVKSRTSSQLRTSSPKRTKTLDTFDSLSRAYKRTFHWKESEIRALALSLSTLLTVHIPNADQVFLFIVGPSGSGKTLLLDSFRLSPHVVFRSSLKARSLASGLVIERSREDPSLLKRLNNKSLVLKDYTEVLSLSQLEQLELTAVLRGAHDGHVSYSWGTGKELDEETRFSLLAGVTDAIHSHNVGNLGERFIKYQFCDGRYFDPLPAVQSAIGGLSHNTEPVYRQCCQFLDSTIQRIQARPPRITVPASLQERLKHLSQLVEHLRTYIPTDTRAVEHTLTPNVATRLSRSLLSLLFGLTIVKGKTPLQVYPDVEVVAWDTCYGHRRDVFTYLLQQRYQTLQDIADRESHLPFGLPTTSIRRQLDALVLVGLIQPTTDKNPITQEKRGDAKKPRIVYTLTTKAKLLVKNAKLSYLRYRL